MTEGIVPGVYVRLPHAPECGLGQVQSVIGTRVTANFEHCGKLVLDLSHAILELADQDETNTRRPR